MEILGIGPLEALFVLILALLVIGPRDLGRMARSFGRSLNRLYRSEAWSAITEASRNLRTLPNRLAREAALEELDEARADLREAGLGVRKELDRFGKELKASRPGERRTQRAADPGERAPEARDPDRPDSDPPESAASDRAAGQAADAEAAEPTDQSRPPD